MQPELVETGELRRKIEALLFVASEALSIKKIAQLCEAEEMEVTTALAEIEGEYAERGIVVRKIAGGFRFATAPSTREVVETYLLPPKTTLSPAALESLAIVAYNEHLEGDADDESRHRVGPRRKRRLRRADVARTRLH